MDKAYSLSRGIISMLERGVPTGAEAEFHFGEALKRQRAAPYSPLSGSMAGGPPALHVPLDLGIERQGVSAGGSGSNLIGETKEIVSPLLTWSAATQAGAVTLTGLRENVSLARVSKLGEPVWSEENGGFLAETDPEFAAVALGPPKRLGGLIKVSKQLLGQAGPGLDQMLADDLARSCSRQLDRIVFYGTGNNNQPLGIRRTPGIHLVPVGDDDPGWDHFCQAEKLIEDEDMGPNSAFIASPALRAELRRRALWNEGSGQTLWDNLTNPISSKAISGEQEHIFLVISRWEW
jgi:HK97 family phage major capsid protein